MTIRECMLYIQNKKESITDEKELDFLDSVFTYLVDYYDHSKESNKEVITQAEIDAIIEGLDETTLNKIKEINNDKNA